MVMAKGLTHFSETLQVPRGSHGWLIEFRMYLASVAGCLATLNGWLFWLRSTVLGDRSRALVFQLVDFNG